jgi:hypothetical protein
VGSLIWLVAYTLAVFTIGFIRGWLTREKNAESMFLDVKRQRDELLRERRQAGRS